MIDLLVVHNFLSKTECQRCMDFADIHATPRHNNSRRLWASFTDKDFSHTLFLRLQSAGVTDVARLAVGLAGELCGLNSFFRVVKYLPGGSLGKHLDSEEYISHGETHTIIAGYTINIFLNTLPSGNGTRFHHSDGSITDFECEQGCAVVFPNTAFAELLHEGLVVGEGMSKYLLRTDIIFQVNMISE